MIFYFIKTIVSWMVVIWIMMISRKSRMLLPSFTWITWLFLFWLTLKVFPTRYLFAGPSIRTSISKPQNLSFISVVKNCIKGKIEKGPQNALITGSFWLQSPIIKFYKSCSSNLGCITFCNNIVSCLFPKPLTLLVLYANMNFT